VARLGDEDREPALNGLNDNDGLLAMAMPAFEACNGRDGGKDPTGGELVSDPMGLCALKADIGLEPLGGAFPWNVDKLPYV
jgi:hypothetical protein